MSKSYSNSNNSIHDQDGYSDSEVAKIHDQLAREKEEPSEGFSPIPIAMLFLFSGIIFWGGVYMAKYTAGFSADYYNHLEASEFRPGASTESAASEPKPVDGSRIYRANCQACHQPNGEGSGGYPPLAGSSWATGNEQRAIRIVLHGLTGPINVDGKEFNNTMAPLGQLTDEQIAAALTYVRSSWGNEAPAVLPETVAAVRAQESSRREHWTAADLVPYQ
jgi:mono/diheme cytochrome c family protein